MAKLFFSGIGGVGMSALAQIAAGEGKTVRRYQTGEFDKGGGKEKLRDS